MNESLFLEKLVFESTFKFLGCISPLPRQIRCRKGLNFYSLFISRGQNRIVHPWFCYRVVVEIPEPHISPTCIIFVVSPWATNNMTNRPIYNSNEFYSSEILKQIDFILKLYPLNTGECSSMQYRHIMYMRRVTMIMILEIVRVTVIRSKLAQGRGRGVVMGEFIVVQVMKYSLFYAGLPPYDAKPWKQHTSPWTMNSSICKIDQHFIKTCLCVKCGMRFFN